MGATQVNQNAQPNASDQRDGKPLTSGDIGRWDRLFAIIEEAKFPEDFLVPEDRNQSASSRRVML